MLSGAALVYSPAFLASLWSIIQDAGRSYVPRFAIYSAWSLVLAPLLSMLPALELANMLQPRKLLHREYVRPFRQVLLGFVAGALSFGIFTTLVLLDLPSSDLPDWMWSALTAFLVTFIAACTLRGIRSGQCVACSYDLSALVPSPDAPARCPECGREVLR